jgi:hypothetical protein
MQGRQPSALFASTRLRQLLQRDQRIASAAAQQSLNHFKAAHGIGTDDAGGLQARHRAPSTMKLWRNNDRLRWSVLAAYVLVLAVTIAAPWLQDRPLGPLCSTSEPLRSGASGSLGDTSHDGMACALCLPLHGAPPAAQATVADTSYGFALALPGFDSVLSTHRGLSPPVRGPPLS